MEDRLSPDEFTDLFRGGGYLGGWYFAQRILQGDRFYVNVQFAWDCTNSVC